MSVRGRDLVAEKMAQGPAQPIEPPAKKTRSNFDEEIESGPHGRQYPVASRSDQLQNPRRRVDEFERHMRFARLGADYGVNLVLRGQQPAQRPPHFCRWLVTRDIEHLGLARIVGQVSHWIPFIVIRQPAKVERSH